MFLQVNVCSLPFFRNFEQIKCSKLYYAPCCVIFNDRWLSFFHFSKLTFIPEIWANSIKNHGHAIHPKISGHTCLKMDLSTKLYIIIIQSLNFKKSGATCRFLVFKENQGDFLKSSYNLLHL